MIFWNFTRENISGLMACVQAPKSMWIKLNYKHSEYNNREISEIAMKK